MNIFKSRVLQMISEQADDKPIDQIGDAHTLGEDLGMDSLSLVELRMKAEDEFGVEFSQEEEDATFRPDATVLSVVEAIDRAVGARA